MVRRLKIGARECARLAWVLSLIAIASLALPEAGAARDIFSSPGLGLTPVPVPRVVPQRTPSGVPALDANQCQLMAGTCPLGRLQRSGGRCFCASGNGTVRQGTTRTKPQDARPSTNTP
ncbi:hypothetical protein C3941_19995 [Kaistia algarum]|uniref:hypothetical protein n=1 Tax=Kaistia algarum TaxID=2083279 RepID=UPI000CE7B76C|nr:hypothetical protein [Kaistia algarum]MCX5513484.1 hypothetical protein [Kaistia algarum]PPE78114.1 hypothetical protein C3941_19995 [Kaistia algarum]